MDVVESLLLLEAELSAIGAAQVALNNRIAAVVVADVAESSPSAATLENETTAKNDGIYFYSSSALELFRDKTKIEKMRFLSGFQEACTSQPFASFAQEC